MSETLSRAPIEKFRENQAQQADQAPRKPEDIDWFRVASDELKAQNEAQAQIDAVEEPVVDNEAVAPIETEAEVAPEAEAPADIAPEVETPVEAVPTPAPAVKVNAKPEAKVHKRDMSDKEIEQRIYTLNKLLDTEPKAHAMAAPAVEAVVSQPTEVDVVEEAPKSEPAITPVETTAEATKIADEEPEVIPEDVVAAVATTMKRADFVKQQEELFGAKDEIKPEDVPEGELTYEQYLAQRPTAEEGDFYRHNGRVYNAAPGGPTSDKKAIYEDKLNNSSADEYYQKLEVQSNRDAVIDEALQDNEVKNSVYDDVIRSNTEGEFLVQNDPMLKGLLKVGEELLELHNSKLTGEDFETKIKPELEEKQAFYDGLYKMFIANGADSRALGYIHHKTSEQIEEPEFIPIEGSGYLNGEKVDILDFTETPDGKKAYTIEKEDGSIEAVYTDQVEFRREFEAYEAPEEEKLSRFERVKKWFGKEIKKVQEYHGMAYMGALFSAPGNWLNTRRVESGMSPAEIQEQKEKNRVRIVLGVAAFTAIRVTAQYAGLDAGGNGEFMASIFGAKPDIDMAANVSGSNYPSVNALEHVGDQAVEQPTQLPIVGYEGTPAPEAVNIDNPIYNIPDGGNLSTVIDSLGITSAQLNERAQELIDLSPGTFYIGDAGDLRINDNGWLPANVRQKFEEIKNSN